MPKPDPLRVADAYLRWALATGFRYAYRDPEERVGLLVVWRGDKEAQAAMVCYGELVAKAKEGRRAKEPLFHVAELYLRGPDPNHPHPAGVWTITVPSRRVVTFLKLFGSLAARVELAAAIGAPNRMRVMAHGQAAKTKATVVVAVLDDGCAFANARFLLNGSTRVAWLWDQNADSRGAPLAIGTGPSATCNLAYGGQWTRAELDQLVTKNGSAEAAYAAAGLGSLRRAAAHGTHVMDLLTRGAKDDWDIVFVQFPREAVDDPSGIWLDKYAGDGLRYVVECASDATKKIVVNLSWGPQVGPHDGSGALEQLIEQLIVEQRAIGRDLHVCLAAGNSFASRAHAQMAHAAGGVVHWVVPPDGLRPQFLEVWWPQGFPMAAVRLRVTPPGGAAIDVIGTGPSDNRIHWELDTLGGSPRLLLSVHPTEEPDPAWRGPHGTWTLEVGASGLPASPEDVHVYVARADHNMGARRRARPSYLYDAALDASRFVAAAQRDAEAKNSSIRRAGTLSGVATGNGAAVIAGYRESDGRPAPYSSSGPSRGARSAPDAACVTDRSLALPGVRASGVRSGTSVTLIGTSTAAPQYGNELALTPLNFNPGPVAPPAPPIPSDPRLGRGRRQPGKDLVHRP